MHKVVIFVGLASTYKGLEHMMCILCNLITTRRNKLVISIYCRVPMVDKANVKPNGHLMETHIYIYIYIYNGELWTFCFLGSFLWSVLFVMGYLLRRSAFLWQVRFTCWLIAIVGDRCIFSVHLVDKLNVSPYHNISAHMKGCFIGWCFIKWQSK